MVNHSNSFWLERVKDTSEISEFERDFKAITTYLEKFETNLLPR